jgi:hypothetical protein
MQVVIVDTENLLEYACPYLLVFQIREVQRIVFHALRALSLQITDSTKQQPRSKVWRAILDRYDETRWQLYHIR